MQRLVSSHTVFCPLGTAGAGIRDQRVFTVEREILRSGCSVHIIWEDMILKTREKEHFHRAMLLLHDRVDHKLLSLNFQKTLLCNL
jgi:hypothetical protein